MTEPSAARPGLRERKKAKTHAAIRQHALRLFHERGYAATTVEEIADAAEVAKSTFFRYFPTKEDVVLERGLDLLAITALTEQPPQLSPLAAFRAAIRTTAARSSAQDLEMFRQTMELITSVPELRSRLLDQFARKSDLFAEALAKRAGRAPDDFAVRNVTGAVIGIALNTFFAAGHELDDYFTLLDAGLAHLEAGLPL